MFRKEHFSHVLTKTRLILSILYWLLNAVVYTSTVVGKTMKKMIALRDFQPQGPTGLNCWSMGYIFER
jgi:hypothetical protein